MSLREELASKTDQNLFCREQRHAFPQKPTRAYYIEIGRSTVVHRMWRCKCGAWASDSVRVSDGEQVERRRIDYTECAEYLIAGYGRIDRRDVRREAIGRIDIEPAPDDD